MSESESDALPLGDTPIFFLGYFFINPDIVLFYFIASSIETATATVAPTIGLFPIPINPIIST